MMRPHQLLAMILRDSMYHMIHIWTKFLSDILRVIKLNAAIAQKEVPNPQHRS